ncbi:class I SAM-dependent methyltransferase [Tichowtungia aerotolerans]|uniref:Methyltransferase domain-containing protein n=1 Tax=Tichowtungia aerotolerans TaxID=2697043 RepID=A0A6P1M6I3_9BACT|nr:class I SAM-dependent methyltransferase [Tichowtungia aerotolerans]QHI69467.1 methyltransferase domain-containing protein [Tichowtungia aerotolerans]
MKALDVNLRNEAVRWQEKLFRRSLRRQTRLCKLRQLLGTTANQDCLEITAGDGVISQQLRLDGGNWKTMVTDSAARDAMQFFVEHPISVFEDNTIDLPDHSFDAVVIVDALERVLADRALIRECHRVLRPDGRLVITAQRKLHFCLGSCPIRALLGLSWRRKGMARPGYTTREFFDVLKDGFDVPETITYSTCCVEGLGLFCEAAANKLAGGPYNMPSVDTDTEQFYHYTKLYTFGTVVYPLMWLFSKIEKAMGCILPGHNMAAKTKRRVWRERRTPQLIDGRSIAEAALNTKIGTAAPF